MNIVWVVWGAYSSLKTVPTIVLITDWSALAGCFPADATREAPTRTFRLTTVGTRWALTRLRNRTQRGGLGAIMALRHHSYAMIGAALAFIILSHVLRPLGTDPLELFFSAIGLALIPLVVAHKVQPLVGWVILVSLGCLILLGSMDY
jgi:hypothetical protein